MINDWEVELGFSAKKVEEGLTKLEARFKKLSTMNAGLSKATQNLEAKLISDKYKSELRMTERNEASKLRLKEASAKEDMRQASWREREDKKESDRAKKEEERRIKAEERIKKVKAAQAAKASCPKARELTFEGRLGLSDRIGNLNLQAETAQAKIANLTDQRSLETKTKLAAAIQRLENLQGRLNGITNRNSREYQNLRQELSGVGIQVRKLSMDSNQLNKRFTASKFATDGLRSSLTNLARSYISVFALIAGFRGMTRIGSDLEDTSAVMLLASGSAKLAAEDMEYIGVLANKTAIRVADLSRSFAKFAVAGRGAGLSTEQVRDTFDDLSVSIRATGLSQDRANLAFLGFQQMLSGPVVQAQEMNQIIEQMPQFTNNAKKALKEMGMEVDNYREAVATGTVNSKEFVSIVARLMSEEAIGTGAFAKSMDSVTAATGKFRITIDEMVKSLFEAGMADILKSTLVGLGNAVKAVTPVLVGLTKVVSLFVKAIAGTFDYMGKFVELLGVKEGEGIVWAMRLMATVAVLTAIPAIAGIVSVARRGSSAMFELAASFLAASSATKKLKWARRGAQTATLLGITMAAGGMVVEGIMNKSSTAKEAALDIQEDEKAMRALLGNVQASAPVVNQTFHIQQSSDPLEHARRTSSAFVNGLSA